MTLENGREQCDLDKHALVRRAKIQERDQTSISIEDQASNRSLARDLRPCRKVWEQDLNASTEATEKPCFRRGCVRFRDGPR